VSELVNSVDFVLVWDEAWLVWVAVSADGDVGTLHTVVVSSSGVDGTSLIGDIVVVHPLVGVDWFTTMATIVFLLTGDDYLRRDVDIGPSSLSGNLDSIRKGRGRSMSPARTAVLWNMLVSHVGQEVGAINVIPEPVRWEILHMLEFLSHYVLSGSQWVPLLLARCRGVNVSKVFLT